MKISHKGIILISIPLVCEFVFVAILFHLQGQLELAADRESRSREIVSTANSILLNVNKLGASGVLMNVLNDDPSQMQELKEIKKEMSRARELMSYSPEQSRNWDLLSYHAQLASQTFMSLRSSILAGERALSGESRRDLRLSLGRLFQDLQRIKDEEERRHKATINDTETLARKRVQYAMWGGVFGTGLLTAVLLSVFYRDIGQKLSVITSTVRQIAGRQKLNDRLSGSDELAALDGVLHEMHQSLEQARRKDRALLDNATALICALDSNLCFLEVSNAAEAVVGFASEELKGVSLAKIADELQVQPLLGLQHSADSPTATEVELSIAKPDGTASHLHLSAFWSPVDSLYFCVAMDISQKKELERMKRDFMNMVSHDLRTPLSSLNIFLEMLSGGVFGGLSEGAVSGLVKSRRSLDRLMELINGLLDLEKVESGQLQLTTGDVSLLGVLADTIEMLEPLCEANEIDIEVNVDPQLTVMADEMRLLQVLQNLMSNAIKYSPSHSTIRVRARVIEAKVEVRIKDEGPGIPKELQSVVFDRFRQLDGATKKGIKGTGIGLSLCKALVELHGGEIGVQSSPREGTEFWFTIPLAHSTIWIGATKVLPG